MFERFSAYQPQLLSVLRIMSGALSTPSTAASGHRSASTAVDAPAPQPRSTASRTATVSGTAASRSRTGRDRSGANRS